MNVSSSFEKRGPGCLPILGGVYMRLELGRGDVDDLEERLRLFLETSIWSRRGQPSAAADAERRGR
jgi:hypothetical protein